jgi:cystathionine beta-lyase/cystathionine gamma-synthase
VSRAGSAGPGVPPGAAGAAGASGARGGAAAAGGAGRPGPSTTAVHGAPHRRADWAPVAPPIVQSSTFVNPVGSDEEVLYTRYGNNPNQVALARKYALLEGAEDAVFVSSGMAATALAHLAVLRPGDHVVSSAWIYGGTRRLFDEEFPRLGIGVTYVDPNQPRLWRRSVRKTTRVIFAETPTNPLLRVVDLGAPAAIAREFGVALLVDATFASPINFRPLEHGADVVITSATKYLNGHSDVVAGAVAGSAALVEEVTRLMQLWGQAIDPHAAWLVDRGLRTLALRMARHNANGQAVAEWAAGHRAFARVHYPGLPSHPDHGHARAALGGFGGMVGLELAGGPAAAERMLKRLRLVTHAPSLAGVETLVSEPRRTSHRALTPEARAALGIPDGFLRLSCGIEDAADIIADLEQAVR